VLFSEGDDSDNKEEGSYATGELSEIFVPFQLSMLSYLVRGLCCQDCGQAELYVMTEEESKPQGLAMKFKTSCGVCGAVCGETYSSTRVPMDNDKRKKNAFDVNRRAVVASIDVGIGHGGLRRMLKTMGMPCLHSNSFELNKRAIQHAVSEDQ
jgi:hypothetical protein